MTTVSIYNQFYIDLTLAVLQRGHNKKGKDISEGREMSAENIYFTLHSKIQQRHGAIQIPLGVGTLSKRKQMKYFKWNCTTSPTHSRIFHTVLQQEFVYILLSSLVSLPLLKIPIAQQAGGPD